MYLCIVVDEANKARVNEVDSSSLCHGYLVSSAPEYTALMDLNLQFNSDLFNLVVGALLLTFVTGHSTGRIVRWLGKK